MRSPLPLPGEPHSVPWLSVPPGWEVRTDGILWYFCCGPRLRSFFLADVAPDRVQAALDEVAATPDPWEGKPPDEVEALEQSFRLFAVLIGLCHDRQQVVVLEALAAAVADTMKNVEPAPEARVGLLMRFFQDVSARMGIGRGPVAILPLSGPVEVRVGPHGATVRLGPDQAPRRHGGDKKGMH